MKPEDKKLLELDICARFPFGVYAKFDDKDVKVIDIYYSRGNLFFNLVADKTYVGVEADRIRPYLRKLSSMTIDEEAEYIKVFHTYPVSKFIAWLYEHHFDNNGLIDLGLACEAPDWMYRDVE